MDGKTPGWVREMVLLSSAVEKALRHGLSSKVESLCFADKRQTSNSHWFDSGRRDCCHNVTNVHSFT